MNNLILSNSVRFFLLLFLQVLILNNINFLGYINPYLYVLFLVLFPFNANRSLFLVLSFLLGLGIDVFEDSGGIHAAACLVAAFIRPYILRFSFGVSYDHQNIKFSSTPFGARFTYVGLLVLVHHFVLFLLEFFTFAHVFLILKKTVLSGIFTILLIFLSLTLFSRKSR